MLTSEGSRVPQGTGQDKDSVIEDRLFRIRNSSVLAWTRNNGLRSVDQQESQQGPADKGGAPWRVRN